MLGLRGVRLSLVIPGLFDMQVRAIAQAAADRKRAGGNPRPEIMIPLVGAVQELEIVRERTAKVLKQVAEETGADVHTLDRHDDRGPAGRARPPGRSREPAEFFSFGTNDLTQMTWGFSRDDVEGVVLLPLPRARHLRRLAVRDDRPRRRRPAGAASPSRRAGRPARTFRSASAASTAATRTRCTSSTRSAWTTCPARRSGCRSPGWRPAAPRSIPSGPPRAARAAATAGELTSGTENTTGYDAHATARWAAEPPKRAGRSAFERDRARVLHSASLRRLAAKTQVVAVGDADFPRTRLTHSLECAQIGRGIGAAIGCDPRPGGNRVPGARHRPPAVRPQRGDGPRRPGRGVRRVRGQCADPAPAHPAGDQGARRGPEPDPGVAGRHAQVPVARAAPRGDGAVARCESRPRPSSTTTPTTRPFSTGSGSARPARRRCLEAQVMDWADDVAYSVHDVEDGLHAGMITFAQLRDSRRTGRGGAGRPAFLRRAGRRLGRRTARGVR